MSQFFALGGKGIGVSASASVLPINIQDRFPSGLTWISLQSKGLSRVFSNELTLCMKGPKYWSFSFSITPSNEHPGLISFGMDWLISLKSKGLSRVFSNTTVQKHQFFSAQFSSQSNSHIHYMTTGKTIALTRQTFVGKVMSLLFNMLSRLVMTILQEACVF